MSMRSDIIGDALQLNAPVIGVSDLIPLPTTAAETSRGVLRLQVPDGCARSWRVTLAPPQVIGATAVPSGFSWPPSLASGNNVSWTRSSTLARVRWGYGSIQHEVEVDWRSGATFVVHASNVTIDVVLPANVQPLAGAGVQVRFRAMAVPCDAGHVPPRTEGLTLSQDVGSILNAATATVLVPRFARAVRMLGMYSGTLSETFTIVFYPTSALATPLAIYQTQPLTTRNWAAMDPLWPWDVPANARWMSIQNNGAAPRSMMLSWLLDLG